MSCLVSLSLGRQIYIPEDVVHDILQYLDRGKPVSDQKKGGKILRGIVALVQIHHNFTIDEDVVTAISDGKYESVCQENSPVEDKPGVMSSEVINHVIRMRARGMESRGISAIILRDYGVVLHKKTCHEIADAAEMIENNTSSTEPSELLRLLYERWPKLQMDMDVIRQIDARNTVDNFQSSSWRDGGRI